MPREPTTRKNMRLSQAKLDRARRILGTKTENRDGAAGPRSGRLS